MKVNILIKLNDGPFGGANQFLKAFRDYLITKKLYVNNKNDAEIILFNSNRSNLSKQLINLYNLRKQRKFIINRIDGPISLKVKSHKFYDKLIWQINNTMVDGAIFQTHWSHEQMKNYTKKADSIPTRIINNAPNKNIFHKPKAEKQIGEKVSIIATSWSPNFHIKGFDIYQFLDENLDFDKYEMTFVGNSPINFKNIKHIKPLDSQELAMQLRKHDVFITASVNDPCSNSLIEAIECGLPTIVRNSGGHPELIKKGGRVFNDKSDVLQAIEKLVDSYDDYKANKENYDIEEIGEEYINFFKEIVSKSTKPKKTTLFQHVKIVILIGLTYGFKYWTLVVSKMSIFKK